ncbi:MAG: hypothetical protein K0S70_15 [Microbacterium sp.]|nr:hypothetical protein [Microbacterium sp.]
MSNTNNHDHDHEAASAGVTPPEEVDPIDGTDENDRPVDNPSG